jgi:hypothetical protein
MERTMAPDTDFTSASAAGDIPLIWASVDAALPHTNFGDALSPFTVAMLSGRRVRKVGSRADMTRMAAIGTIGQNLVNGRVHLWGTGFDAGRDPMDRAATRYALPPATAFVAHAVRGRHSAALLRREGVKVPDVFGDPGWFMPKFFPLKNRPKTHELGVVLHITELTDQSPAGAALAEYKRYQVPPSLQREVTLINTFAERSIEGVRRKIAQIVSCKRIVSTSLHGLVIAEAYGIPCAWFGFVRGQARAMKLGDANLDHRVADFYSGTGRDTVAAYLWPRTQTLDWDDVMRGVDRLWFPLDYDGRALFQAFPMKTEFGFDRPKWPVKPELLEGVPI